MPSLVARSGLIDPESGEILDPGRTASVTVSGVTAAMTLATIAAGDVCEPRFRTWESLCYVLQGTLRLATLDAADLETIGAETAGPGAYVRIPPCAVHRWENPGLEAALLIEFCVPEGPPSPTPLAEPHALLAPWEPLAGAGVPDRYLADLAAYPFNGNVPDGPLPAGIVVGPEAISRFLATRVFAPDEEMQKETNFIDLAMVHGNSASLIVADRGGHYHSEPHVHQCEQFNYLARGRLTLFALGPDGDYQACPMQAGDFSRIPFMAVHWAWNPTDEPAVLVELHNPGFQSEPHIGQRSVPLFREGEVPNPGITRVVRNLYVDRRAEARAVEERPLPEPRVLEQSTF
jgi:mannose-6-phosphate isomerase-like protein (cupin superfamily)